MRRVLPELGTGMGTDVGTGLGTGMQRAEITVTGGTNLRACRLWCSSQGNCNACAVPPVCTEMAGNMFKLS